MSLMMCSKLYFLIERMRTEREQTPSRFFVKGLNEVQGFENVSCELKSILSLDEKAEQQNWED